LRLAENHSDARLVVRVAKQIINGRKVEIHLAAEFGLEVFHFQIYDDVCSEAKVIEEQINAEFLATYLQRILATHKREPCAEFQQKVAEMINQGAFQIPLVRLFGEG